MNALLDKLSLGFSYLILLAATIMFCWGVLGFLEYFTGLAPVLPLQNATFPNGTQFMHWLIITASGTTYLVGYFTRWRYTPIAMLVMFGALGTLCAIQTFDFMVKPSRYNDFWREIFYYCVMSVYLVKSKRMHNHFGRIDMVGSEQSNHNANSSVERVA
ncbi:MAG: hypothetical protein AAF478_13540 [Pseudomonadota bacterium]